MCDLSHHHDADFGFIVDTPEIRALIEETERATRTMDGLRVAAHVRPRGRDRHGVSIGVLEREMPGGGRPRGCRAPVTREIEPTCSHV
ncbi:MAG: hypothetical protein HYU37_04540 [Acidobacteria bacterium]|nr:hypothetical protein [Acidobacteriota bacterium]